uniref:DRBM domain-containing protein n=1 Tax=Coturnix japonica TaxID=93934 RepID=A0A8C2T7H9_COTJA
MLSCSPGKTPISLLQEYGTRIGRTPGYDLLKAEGQAHQPNFTFRVTVGDVSCTGQGPSKKAAKHKAAEVALKLLKGGDMLEPGAPEEPRLGGRGGCYGGGKTMGCGVNGGFGV